MNSTESAYAAQLELRKRVGEVEWYAYEALKYRLADKTFLTPDFAVMLADGTLEAHEVKGFMREDAAVKLKVAASLFPIKFLLVRKRGQTWDITEI